MNDMKNGEKKMKEKLVTIQKRGKLNEVFAAGDGGPGGAFHDYEVCANESGELIAVIQFQKGARKDPAARHGVIDSDLIEMVRDRLKAFNKGEFATRENACAITHLEEALMWMNRRVEDRLERDVLGTYEK